MILNDYFDKIFCHNLDRSFGRWNKVNKRFEKHNLNVERRSAIDGASEVFRDKWESLSEREKIIMQRPTTYAIVCTYRETINYCIEKGYEKVLLLEDDVTFHKDFKDLSNKKVEYLPDDWDMVWLGGSQVNYDNVGVQYNEHYKIADTVDGLLAVGIKSNMFKPLLELWDRMVHTADSSIMQNIQPNPKYHCYAATPRLFGHDYGYSFNFKNTVLPEYLTKENMLYYDPKIYI